MKTRREAHVHIKRMQKNLDILHAEASTCTHLNSSFCFYCSSIPSPKSSIKPYLGKALKHHVFSPPLVEYIQVFCVNVNVKDNEVDKKKKKYVVWDHSLMLFSMNGLSFSHGSYCCCENLASLVH